MIFCKWLKNSLQMHLEHLHGKLGTQRWAFLRNVYGVQLSASCNSGLQRENTKLWEYGGELAPLVQKCQGGVERLQVFEMNGRPESLIVTMPEVAYIK